MIVQEWVVGKENTCDVRVEDIYVSNRHAIVHIDNEYNYWVQDLGSTNGTWIRRGTDTIRVYTPRRIYQGDTLIIGRSEISWKK